MIPAHRKKIEAVVRTLYEQIKAVKDPTEDWKAVVMGNLLQIVQALPEPDKTTMVMTPQEAQEYFVNAVQSWRTRRDMDPAAGADGEDPESVQRRKDLKFCATFYVDAFQSTHLALFGELVPGVDKPENQEEL